MNQVYRHGTALFFCENHEEFVVKLRVASSPWDAANIDEYMKNYATRVAQLVGRKIETKTADAFVESLIKAKIVTVAAAN